jgi:hypothetical protein
LRGIERDSQQQINKRFQLQAINSMKSEEFFARFTGLINITIVSFFRSENIPTCI